MKLTARVCYEESYNEFHCLSRSFTADKLNILDNITQRILRSVQMELRYVDWVYQGFQETKAFHFKSSPLKKKCKDGIEYYTVLKIKSQHFLPVKEEHQGYVHSYTQQVTSACMNIPTHTAVQAQGTAGKSRSDSTPSLTTQARDLTTAWAEICLLSKTARSCLCLIQHATQTNKP